MDTLKPTVQTLKIEANTGQKDNAVKLALALLNLIIVILIINGSGILS